MKTQEQMQTIYDALISTLQSTNFYCLMQTTKSISGIRQDMPTPLEHYVELLKKELKEEDFNEVFLRNIYSQAFYIGEIPYYRNHIAMTCALTIAEGETSPLLKYWIDLDKVAALTNHHFRMNPPHRFRVKYDASDMTVSGGCSGGMSLKQQFSYAVNSVDDPYKRNIYFLIAACVCGVVSAELLLFAALAAASIMTLNISIYTAVGISALAGLASYGFFTTRDSCYTNSVSSDEHPQDIFELFQKHFEPTINAARPPEARAEEVVREQQVVCIP